MAHRICTVTITGMSRYSPSRAHFADKLEKELADAYARRTWRLHCHADKDGHVVIPQMSLKNLLSEGAKRLGMQVPGKGKATYTKHFEGGVMVTDPITLPYRLEDLTEEEHMERLFLPSDGIRGSGKRVLKYFPYFDNWGGRAQFHVFDEVITENVFAEILAESGRFVGLGRFRPAKNGHNGRFAVSDFVWSKA